MRRDRSALLIGEGGGKLGRRDVGLFLVIFFAALFLRTYRLEVPYGMHFDEVYHARTAMEFLQDWRYGIPHSIYEFTHPHVAKYGMASGIEATGQPPGHVYGRAGRAATTDAAIEQRWSPTDQPDVHLGDRLYVATGSDVDVYDLEQPGPAQVASIAGALRRRRRRSRHAHRSTWARRTARSLRCRRQASTTYDVRRPLGRGPGSAARRRSAQSADLDGRARSARRDRRPAHRPVDPAARSSASIRLTGAETGRATVDGAADFISAPSHGVVTVDPAQVTDRSALAQQLASMLQGLSRTRIEQADRRGHGPVPVDGYIGDKKTDVQTQIDDGNLPGVSISRRHGRRRRRARPA